MINAATAAYIRQHADGDVRQLALQGTRDPSVELAVALNQIAGRQAARRKLPSWAAIDGIVYPPHLSMEQCSGELTARYKASVAGKALKGISATLRFADLTGGFGVDFAFIARALQQDTPTLSNFTYVERQDELCQIVRHNFRLLGLEHARIECSDAETYLQQMSPADLIYIDPARRDSHGGRTYDLGDCTPDVLALLPLLLAKSRRLLLKLSPMLDWRKAVADLGASRVSAVHIVAAQNECKELLIVMESEEREDERALTVHCVNLFPDDTRQSFGYCPHLSTENPLQFFSFSASQPSTSTLFLYEPNAAIMKAGCFAELAQHYAVSPLALNSHLFVADRQVDDFPGRTFCINGVSTLNKRSLKAVLQGMTRANIAVRNFPLSADELRRRLKLSEGGSNYIFATTLANGDKVLILCRKP